MNEIVGGGGIRETIESALESCTRGLDKLTKLLYRELIEEDEFVRQRAERGRSFTRAEMSEALEWAIRQGYARAYLLSAQPPYTQQVDFSPEDIGDLSFFVTPEGKQLVKYLEDAEH